MRRRIESEADLVEGLDYLRWADPRLHKALDAVNDVPMRISTPDFAGIARIIIAQQVSVASAQAITQRTTGQLGELSATAFRDASDEDLRDCGLSRPKQRTLRAVAHALPDEAAFIALNDQHPSAVEDQLVSIHGVGPWTAQIYTLFCLADADIMPAGDLALQKAAAWALDEPKRLSEADLRAYAEKWWTPWRGVAVRLLWSYHAVVQDGRSGIAL